MSLKPYPKYKESGADWLGEVPVGWEIAPYKRLVEIQNGADYKHVEQEEGYPVIGSGGPFTFASEYLYDGESVLLGRKGTVDKPLYVNGRFWTVDTMYWTKIRPSANGRFAYYAALTIPFAYYSTSTALPSMTQGALNAHLVALPSRAEQTAIAAFLDRETAKIDGLIAEQEKLIALLAEKRQATISHAVTKGLNPDAPMKDSGVEWLGEIPAHWVSCAARRIIRRIEQGWSPECFARPAEISEWGVLKAGCVNRGVFAEDENKALPGGMEPIPEYEVKSGDVLMSRASGSRELIGSVAYVKSVRSQIMLSDKIFRLRLEPQMNARFFVFLFNAIPLRKQIEQAISGAEGLANNLPQSALRTFYVTVPPMNEQEQIVDFITTELDKLDALSNEASRVIDLLKERRTALISAAITGKIDVRDAVSTSEAA